MELFLAVLALIGLLYVLHRVALWAEGRGWVYYLNSKPSSSTLGNAFLEIQSMIEPEKRPLVEALGLPAVRLAFFPNVLGGVLIGIGIALLLARRSGATGLGLDGAIAINLCGAGVVVGWLLVSPDVIPTRGRWTLWTVAAVVIGIGIVELRHRKTE